MEHIKKIIFYLSIQLSLSPLFSQYTSTSIFDIGPDHYLSCNNSITLNANFLSDCTSPSGYIVESIPYSPPVPFSSGNIPALLFTDDVYSDLIPLDFIFCFFKNPYDSVIIGTNGVLSFDKTQANQYCPWLIEFFNCPHQDLPRNSIFGVYHDLELENSGEVRCQVSGTLPNRIFVFNCNQIPLYNPCSQYIATHQIVLYEGTNIIEVHIQDKPLCTIWNSGRSILGIQDSSGIYGLAAPGRNTNPVWSAQNEAWRFIPCVDSISYRWYENGVLISDSQTVVVSPSITSVYVAECSYRSCNDSIYILSDTCTIFIQDSLNISFSYSSSVICPGDSVSISVSGGTQYEWGSIFGSDSVIVVTPLVTTTYCVTVSDQYSCSNSACITIDVEDVDYSITYSNGMLSAAQDSAIYKWCDCNQAFSQIPGANQQNFIPVMNGDYAVIIEHLSCTDTSFCINVSDVALNEFIHQSLYIFYPNPNNGNFYIDVDEELKFFNASIKVYTPTGTLVFETDLLNNNNQIQTFLNPGFYLLILNIDENIYYKKISIFKQ